MRHGFSLVELSIVLVILGLLTGGILAGQSLIRAAELRGIVTQHNNILAATRTFRDKYMALPGDFANATQFWGTATHCPGAYNQPSTTAATCNGDGDGLVEYYDVATSHELHRFWQHLANAGLIEGSYTGVQTSSASVRSYASGINAPSTKISNSVVSIGSYGNRTSGDPYWWQGNYDNQLIMSLAADSNGYGVAMLRPDDMWNIDMKLDDGRPAQGKIRSYRKNFHTSCTTTNVEATSEYDLTGSTIACSLISLALQ